MFDAIQNFVAQNFEFLVGVTSFVCGVCLLYLVMWRTIQKRQLEADEANADQAQ